MADITTNSVPASSGASISKALLSAFEWFVRLSENTSRARAIEALSALSDAELEARGTNRKDEIMRIIGPSAFI